MAGKNPAEFTARGASCPLNGARLVSAKSKNVCAAKVFGCASALARRSHSH
jgi:hypothetical protein